MKQYVFILGNHPKLSKLEIEEVYNPEKTEMLGEHCFLVHLEESDCKKLLDRLGGTIKIAELLGKFSKEKIVEELLKQEGKIIFGISRYDTRREKLESREVGKWKSSEIVKWERREMSRSAKPVFSGRVEKLGIEIKKILKGEERQVRFVTSKEPILSSVIVKKNKCTEFLLLPNDTLAKTRAVQDFEEYGKRDFGRPARDPHSGMLPPKIAQIMINLSKAKKSETILDPFCGSGTILQETLLMGFEDVMGSDVSQKAIIDSKVNMEWLKKNYELGMQNYELFHLDVRSLSKKIKKVDAIVTEPFLGPPLKGHESKNQIENTMNELSRLYLDSFREFHKILSKGGRIVIIFPVFTHLEKSLSFFLLNHILHLGFVRMNKERLIYSRTEQKVQREILIFEKN